MSPKPAVKPPTDRVDQFFAMARAQSKRVSGHPSGDPHLDSLTPFNPSGDALLAPHLFGLTVSHGIRMCLVDWWTGGQISQDGPLRRRLYRWVTSDDPTLHTRVADLLWLDQIGTVKLAETAPAREVDWATCAQVIARVDAAKVRSMGQVFDLTVDLLGARRANHLVRLMRPLYGELPDSAWVHVTKEAACGLSFAMTGRPFGLHPVASRQEAARHMMQELLTRSTDPSVWPEDEFPFTADSLLLFCEFAWLYLKRVYPHLKDPV